MATVNRYTRLQPARYTPRSLQEMMIAPSYMRGQHEELAASAQSLGAIDSERLRVDDPAVQEAIGDYEGKIESYVDKLNREGFSGVNKGYITKLAREKRSLMGPSGTLGKAKVAYDAYQANVKEVKQLYTSGKIGAEKYQLGLQKALADYKGVAEDSTYDPFVAAPDVDIRKQARQLALDMQKNPEILTKFGLVKKGNRYYDQKLERSYTPENAINYVIQSMLSSDTKIQSDLAQREQLGILGDQTAKEYLQGIGEQHEAFYAKDQTKVTQSGFFDPLEMHRAKKQINDEFKSGQLSFEKYGEKKIEIYNKEEINALDDALMGGFTAVPTGIDPTSSLILSWISGIINSDVTSTAEKYDQLEGGLKTKIDVVFKGLKLNNQLSQDAVITDPKVLKRVIEAVKSRPIIRTSPKVVTSTAKVAREKEDGLRRQIRNRQVYDIENNEILNYEDLKDEGLGDTVFDRLESKDILYKGEMNEEHNYTMLIPAANQPNFMAPEVFEIDGKTYLVSPPASVMASEDYRFKTKANREFNKLSQGYPVAYDWDYITQDGTAVESEVTIRLTAEGRYMVSFINPETGKATVEDEYLDSESMKEMFDQLTPKN